MADEVITQFKETYANTRAGKIALVTMDNGFDYKKPNTFGTGGLASLNACLDRIAEVPDVKALVLTGKVFIFAVGADLTQVETISTFEEAKNVAVTGHAAFKRLMELPYPTVAAINGAVMGGGLEIALACGYRTISTGVPALSFPECFIGLLPGWGGTTLLPKLLGPEKALQVIISNALNNNKMINGKAAFELGIADRIYEPVDFLDKSIEFAIGLLEGSEKVERPAPDFSNVDALCDAARALADGKTHGKAPAPYKAIEIIRQSGGISVDEGFALEDDALGELIISDQCRASVYSFDLVQRRAKKPVGVPEGWPSPVTKIGVLGAGLMGSQLAMLFLRRLKVPIVIKDIKQEFVDKGLGYIQGELAKQAEKGRIDKGQLPWLTSLVQGTLDYADMADCDFIIEAVLEEMPIKKKVFGELEEVISETCILATNTSSMPITEMSSDLKHPERVVGFHFFNPVAAMPLLEIVRGDKTNDQTLVTAFDIARKIGKKTVLCKDRPAFVVNRLLIRMMVVNWDLVDEGNTFQEIDTALIELGAPMPPFILLALVGPAVGMHALETLADAFPDRYHVSPNIRKLVEMKKPGVYGADGVDAEYAAQMVVADPPKKATPQEMIDRTCEAVTTEIGLMLDDGVVAGPEEIDLCMIFGAGYPFWNGGLTKFLDYAGYSEKVLGKKFH
jgi:3-hydroxyacyl-CoA dehydrogenase/enoyl-CoA hydratase/carnithine racemase